MNQQGATNAIILNKDEEFLITERSKDDDFMPGYWELPGGGMDYGETLQDCIVREIKEECGIKIKIIKPVAANTYFIKKLQRIEITYLCKAISTSVMLSDEHTNFRWIKKKQINSFKTDNYIKNILNSVEDLE